MTEILCSTRQEGNSYHERLKDTRLLKALYKIFSSSSRICTSPSISHLCLMENFETDFMSCRVLRTSMNFLGAHLFTHRKCKFRIAWGFIWQIFWGVKSDKGFFNVSLRNMQDLTCEFSLVPEGFFPLLEWPVQISSCLICELHVLSGKSLFPVTEKSMCSVCDFMGYHVITRLLFGKTLLIFILIITVLT